VLQKIIWMIWTREMELVRRRIEIGLVVVGPQGAKKFGLRRTILHLLVIVVGELGGRVRCEGGRGVTDRRGTTTDARTGRGSLRRIIAAPCIVPRTFANDVRLHGNGTSRAMQFVIQATSVTEMNNKLCKARFYSRIANRLAFIVLSP